jgi:LacI family transcriptional regulator
MSENREAAAQAVAHLHELGHERIATISGPLWTRPGTDRLAGYRETLERLGVEVHEDYVREGDFYDESGYEATKQLLALEAPPTAIFAASDLMAAGALRAAHELGVNVPEELAVVGFDDIEPASLLTPPLTTVINPAFETGFEAGRLLGERMRGVYAGPARTVTLPSPLVIRATS